MNDTDAALAARLAHEAGELLLDLRRSHGSGRSSADDSADNSADNSADMAQLRDAGDAQAHQFIVSALAEHRPADAVLSEEGVDDPARLRADRVWIVDPLDGTNEFGEARSDWAVHVALWQRGAGADGLEGDLVAGAVALPARDVTLASHTVRRTESPSGQERPMRIAVSRSRPPDVAVRAAGALGAELVPIGSAGYKVASVVLGEVDAYIHAGGQFEWDSAAPVAVARAAGLHTSRIDGTPLRYNAPNPYLPDLLVTRVEFADAILAACSNASSRPVSAVPRSTP